MADIRTTTGIALIAGGVVLPPLVWFGGQALLAAEAARDPVPDQGGMVVVFLAFWASVAVAAVLGLVGLVVLLRRRPAGG